MWTWQRDFETAPAADPGSNPATPMSMYGLTSIAAATVQELKIFKFVDSFQIEAC